MMKEEPHPAPAPAGANVPAVPPTTPASAVTPPTLASALTPEEQMALFEKDLKENDWGHQPC